MKFVILHHLLPSGESHYDLMFEVAPDKALETWQLEEKHYEKLLHSETVIIKQINDHRREYLHYEGPVSQNRGEVECCHRGEYTLVHETKNKKTLKVKETLLIGTLTFTFNKKDSPTLSYVRDGEP